jgi:hypothetical protein
MTLAPGEAVGRIEYVVRVTGHEPPFVWELFKVEPNGLHSAVRLSVVGKVEASTGGSTVREEMANAQGSANSYEGALDAGRDAAREAEWDRQWAGAVVEETVLTADVYEEWGTCPKP